MSRIAYNENGSYYYDTTNAVGYVDFAGSGIVHCTGGIAALMGSVVIGARIGKFSVRNNQELIYAGEFKSKTVFIVDFYV